MYVLSGSGEFGGEGNWTESKAHHTLVLGPGSLVEARNTVSRAELSAQSFQP